MITTDHISNDPRFAVISLLILPFSPCQSIAFSRWNLLSTCSHATEQTSVIVQRSSPLLLASKLADNCIDRLSISIALIEH